MNRSSLLALALAVCAHVPAVAQSEPVPLLTNYQTHRFFVRAITERGDTLNLYTDTGGGANVMMAGAVQRAGLRVRAREVRGDTVRQVRFPELRRDGWIPAPHPRDSLVTLVDPNGANQRAYPPDMVSDWSGFLSSAWFRDRVWILDYPGRRMSWVRASGAAPSGARTVPLGFRHDSAGKRVGHFPRISVEIAGDSLGFLFDTGATSFLTDSALALLADGDPALRAGSFIGRETFDRWRAAHPEWRVVLRGERYTDADLIQVPSVRVAGHEVGPVWFSTRPPGTFVRFSRAFDQPVVGALGGYAFRTFRITLDYPAAQAHFERTGP